MTDLDGLKSELQKLFDIADETAAKELSKLRSTAEKKLKDVNRRLENLGEASTEFQESINEDSNVMDKYSQNIYDKIQSTLSEVVQPTSISLRNLELYLSTLRNGLVEQDKVLIKYIKLLKDRKYKGRVKTLDKSLSRMVKDLKALEDFVKTDYAPSAGVESASTIIEETIHLLDTYAKRYEELVAHENEVKMKMAELKNIEQSLEELKSHPTLENYQKARLAYEELQRAVDLAFSNIRKVFRKYDRYMSKQRKPTNSELISDLVTDAASALAKQPNIGSVEALLREIEDSLGDASLNLARDKKENAQQDIQRFLDGKLKEYYDRSKEIVGTKDKLTKELSDLQLDSKIETTERDLAAAKRDMSRIYQRELRSLMDVNDQIIKNMESVNNSSVVAGKHLHTKLPEPPEWAE